ncbi:hypothetical protein OESDEN_12094 [Oesophagostomum dentatum]|uniref:MoaB/Mog domain-containing protein n=1 Tax=Oesophagostomum dentatum TaxID=61180 RepID=A0A0B1SY79_OESDE|nr:hypothetical protein OESDEN_12094 [Oesophagostomum dentatum]
MSAEETSHDGPSVVHRPRQSTWRAVPMNEALAFVEKADVMKCVKYIPVAAARGNSPIHSIPSLYLFQMSAEETSHDGPSVVHRPRQSTWRAVPMNEALAFVEKADVMKCVKYIPVAAARVGQVLAERIVAKENVPLVRTSIKDGYAVLASDSPGERKVVGSSTAGAPFTGNMSSGECVRVSTGAAVPDGADAVVMIENTTLIKHDGVEELIVSVNASVKPGQDIRMPGSDVRKGDLLLDVGCVLGSAEIGILAGSGKRSVLMYRRPKVCVLSTGNELAECTADEIPLGHIRDTNRPQLIALFSSLGFKAIDAGIAVDRSDLNVISAKKVMRNCYRRECLVEAIRVSLQYAHVLVTSGGVSMGEKDLLKDVLVNDFGFEIHFGRVWMKPGLPTTFATGEIDGDKKFVLALPGNPVSSWVTAQLFAVPLLKKAAGHLRIFQQEIKVQLAEDINLDARPEYRRAWLQHGGNLPVAISTGNQISSRLMSLSGATVLLRIPSKTDVCPKLKAGEGVEELIVSVNASVKPGQDIRMPGSDVRKGDLLLDVGCVLGSAEIGILAGSGKRSVLMYRRPKVCVLSTGNELAECTADEIPLGHIRDTNRPQLIALFSSLGFKAIDAGIAVDRSDLNVISAKKIMRNCYRRECLVEAIRVSLQYAHVLVTSGGVSMGEKDLLKDVLVNDFGFEVITRSSFF